MNIVYHDKPFKITKDNFPFGAHEDATVHVVDNFLTPELHRFWDSQIVSSSLWSKTNQVGSDRIVNSIAAIKLFKKNSIIVDFGTATTFDIILSNKSYEGGVIAPGVKLSINSMYQATANLPLIKLRNQKKITGKDTVSAMN